MADLLDVTGWAPRPWDSAFFGVNIAQITGDRSTPAEMTDAVRTAQDASVDCLYYLVDAADQESVRVAEQHRFSLVDIRLTLECAGGTPLHDAAAAAGSVTIRRAHAGDLPLLTALARANHRNTRFHQDARFDRGRSDELYAVWIERSVNGELADAVWVVDVDDAARGYLTVKASGDTATIGLVAVDPALRGRGHGVRLLQTALRWAADRGLRRTVVATQGRSAASIRFYQRAGFTPTRVELWYHRWLRG